jgi:hypothetical protein
MAKLCSSCNEEKERVDYSKKQWLNKASIRRCLACIDSGSQAGNESSFDESALDTSLCSAATDVSVGASYKVTADSARDIAPLSPIDDSKRAPCSPIINHLEEVNAEPVSGRFTTQSAEVAELKTTVETTPDNVELKHFHYANECGTLSSDLGGTNIGLSMTQEKTSEKVILGELLVLISGQALKREVLANTEMAFTILTANKIPYVVLEGGDPSNKDRRNELFDLSGLRGQYPQFFLVNGETTTFYGDWDHFQSANDNGTLKSELSCHIADSNVSSIAHNTEKVVEQSIVAQAPLAAVLNFKQPKDNKPKDLLITLSTKPMTSSPTEPSKQTSRESIFQADDSVEAKRASDPQVEAQPETACRLDLDTTDQPVVSQFDGLISTTDDETTDRSVRKVAIPAMFGGVSSNSSEANADTGITGDLNAKQEQDNKLTAAIGSLFRGTTGKLRIPTFLSNSVDEDQTSAYSDSGPATPRPSTPPKPKKKLILPGAFAEGGSAIEEATNLEKPSFKSSTPPKPRKKLILPGAFASGSTATVSDDVNAKYAKPLKPVKAMVMNGSFTGGSSASNLDTEVDVSQPLPSTKLKKLVVPGIFAGGSTIGNINTDSNEIKPMLSAPLRRASKVVVPGAFARGSSATETEEFKATPSTPPKPKKKLVLPSAFASARVIDVATNDASAGIGVSGSSISDTTINAAPQSPPMDAASFAPLPVAVSPVDMERRESIPNLFGGSTIASAAILDSSKSALSTHSDPKTGLMKPVTLAQEPAHSLGALSAATMLEPVASENTESQHKPVDRVVLSAGTARRASKLNIPGTFMSASPSTSDEKPHIQAKSSDAIVSPVRRVSKLAMPGAFTASAPVDFNNSQSQLSHASPGGATRRPSKLVLPAAFSKTLS